MEVKYRQVFMQYFSTQLKHNYQMRKAKYCIEIRLYYDNIFQGWNTEEQGNIPSKGGSQLTLASV